VVVASQDYPLRSWLGSEVHEATLAPVLDAAAAHVHEGRAQLEIWATDYSWLARFHRGPRLARAVTVDVTPPLLEVMPGEHVARVGGSECAVYRVGPDAVHSGVQVGDEFFPGVPATSPTRGCAWRSSPSRRTSRSAAGGDRRRRGGERAPGWTWA